MLNKFKIILISALSCIILNQSNASQSKKDESCKQNILSYIGITGCVGIPEIQNIIKQYLNGWDLTQYDGHNKRISAIAQSADGHYLASMDSDGNIKLWDILNKSNASCVITLANGFSSKNSSRDEVNKALAFSPNGKYLAANINDHGFTIFDIQNKNKTQVATNFIRSIFRDKRVNVLAYSPDNKFIIGGESEIVIFDVQDTNIKLVNTQDKTDSHFWEIFAIAISPNGQLMATADANYSIIIWDIVNLPEIRKICDLSGDSNSMNSVMSSLAFSPNNRYLTSSSLGLIKFWDLNDIDNINCLAEFPSSIAKRSSECASVNSVSYSSNGKYLVSGQDNGTAIIWDLNDLEKIRYSNPLSTPIIEFSNVDCGRILFSNDSSTIFFAGIGNKLNIWTNTAKLLSLNNAITDIKSQS